VTGASTGIGRSFALELAKSGFDLTIVSRSQTRLDQVAADIAEVAPDVKVQVVPLDLTKATNE